MDARNPHGGVLAQRDRHLDHRVDLASEVQLGTQTLRELSEDLARADSLSERGPPLRDVGEQRQGREVTLDDRLHVGTLHLDHDRIARAQSRAVGLADGRGTEWCPVELCEHGVDGGAELRFEHRFDGFPRLGRHLVLQPGEFDADLRREQVDARARRSDRA